MFFLYGLNLFNEIRQIIGMKPSDDPKADELKNSNISEAKSEPSSSEDTGIAEVKKRVAVMEENLKRLTKQEEKYAAELEDALKQYAELKEQAVGIDAAELIETRLAVREEKERSAVEKVKSAYSEKYDPMLMHDSKHDVANLLHEEAEVRSVREFVRQKQQQQAQQKQNKKKRRDSWER